MVLPELSLEEIDYELRHRYDTRTQWIYANIGASLFCAVTAVILRFVARRKRGLKLAWNDYTIVVALVMTVANCAVIVRASVLGLGLHVVVVGKNTGIKVAQMLVISIILFPLAASTIRLSILMFYIQVFGNGIPWFKIGVRILAALWILLALVAFLTTSIQCVPLKLAWTSNHAEHCLDIEKLILSLTIIAIVLNFATLFLPLPLIWKLRLNLRKKIAIGGLFAIAGGDIVINIFRASVTHEISPRIIDVTWVQVNNAVLAILELNIAIICACVPTLQPLFNRIANKISSGIEQADLKHQILTVPFVLMKTKSAGTKPETKVKLQRASKLLRNSSKFAANDEEKLIDTSLPPYSQISQAKSTWKGLFRKSGSFARWPGGRNREELSEKTLLGTQNSTLTWKPETPLQGEIAKSFIQSGYPKAKYSTPPRVRRSEAEPDSVFTLSAQPRESSRTRSRGLNLDTRDTTVRPDSRGGAPSRTSPFTSLSGATFFNSPEKFDPHPGKKFPIPGEDEKPNVLRTLSQRSWKRRPSGPTLSATRYQPSPTLPAKAPTREKTGKRKGPHYVRSPLTDPDSKIRFGSPKEVMISTPNRGRSLKGKAPALDEQEPTIPKLLEPHYQGEVRLDTPSPEPESAMPSPLQVEARGLGLTVDEGKSERPSASRDRLVDDRRDLDRLPRSNASQNLVAKKTPRERWYIEPTANSFSWNEPEVPLQGKEKPLPPLPPR